MEQVHKYFCYYVTYTLHARIANNKYTVNMDQTNIYFNFVPQKTVYRKGELALSVRLGGYSYR